MENNCSEVAISLVCIAGDSWVQLSSNETPDFAALDAKFKGLFITHRPFFLPHICFSIGPLLALFAIMGQSLSEINAYYVASMGLTIEIFVRSFMLQILHYMRGYCYVRSSFCRNIFSQYV